MKRFASLFTGSADDEIHETITLLFKEKHSLLVKNIWILEEGII